MTLKIDVQVVQVWLSTMVALIQMEMALMTVEIDALIVLDQLIHKDVLRYQPVIYVYFRSP